MIISVSDVHLGEEGFQKEYGQFSKFLEFIRNDELRDGGHLVLLGDIFDFWRKDSSQIFEDYADVIVELFEFPKDVDIHYVVGNHDFYLSEIPGYFDARPFEFFGSAATIKDGHVFRFIHGYHLEVMANPYSKDMNLYESLARRLSYHSGLTGRAASCIGHAISFLTKSEGDYMSSMLEHPESRLKGRNNAVDRLTALAKFKSRCLFLGGSFDWLVFGHTHSPFLDPESWTINTGSWGRGGSDGKMWYLKIQNGIPELAEWSEI
jgi:UDP-2,3-diacylglucosamine pyrophosphatase LpxH